MGWDISKIKKPHLREALSELKSRASVPGSLSAAEPQVPIQSSDTQKQAEPDKSTQIFTNNQIVKTVTIPVLPCPKPRMTQRDVWKKRPCVVRYRVYCDVLREKFGPIPDNAGQVHVVAHIPMPTSWKAKKQGEIDGQPHRQRPDSDNLTKAVMDALLKEDSGIWYASCQKFWCKVGEERVEITIKSM